MIDKYLLVITWLIFCYHTFCKYHNEIIARSNYSNGNKQTFMHRINKQVIFTIYIYDKYMIHNDIFSMIYIQRKPVNILINLSSSLCIKVKFAIYGIPNNNDIMLKLLT